MFNTLYNIIDNSILFIYCATIAYLFLAGVEFIIVKIEQEDWAEPLPYNEVAKPPVISKSEPLPLSITQSIAQDISPTALPDLSSLHISKLRTLAGVPSTSRLTKKELLAILND